MTALQLITKIHFMPVSTHLEQIISLYDQAKNLKYTVVLAWVPEHSGVFGNELADSVARQAAISISHSDPILPGGDVKPVI